MARKSEDNATNDAMDLLEDRGSSIVVPQAPQTETRRTSRRGGSSRTASRSSSPGESVGLPDEDETDEKQGVSAAATAVDEDEEVKKGSDDEESNAKQTYPLQVIYCPSKLTSSEKLNMMV